MLKAKHLNKISKLYDSNNDSVLSQIEKMMIENASKGRYEIEINNDLLDLDIQEKLTRKGFTFFYGNITTCVSWGNI